MSQKEQNDRNDQIEIKTSFENSSNEVIKLYIEPWGEELLVNPSEKFYIKGTGQKENSGFSILYGEQNDKKYVKINAWANSTVEVFNENGDLEIDLDLETPDFRM